MSGRSKIEEQLQDFLQTQLENVRTQIKTFKEKEKDILRKIHKIVYVIQCTEVSPFSDDYRTKIISIFSSLENALKCTPIEHHFYDNTYYSYEVIERDSKDMDLRNIDKRPSFYHHEDGLLHYITRM